MTDQPADDGHVQQAYLQQLHRTIGGLNTANGTFRQQLRAAEDELARLRPLPAQLAAAQREAEHARALAQIAESRTEDWRRAHRDQVGLVTRLETQVAAAQAELANLHEGEEPYDDERMVPTPGQWIWQWNRATPAKRLEVVGKILDDADHRYGCFMNNWPDRARNAEARIAAVRALADTLDAEEAYGGARDAKADAADRIRAAVDGPADQPATEQAEPCDHRDPKRLGARPYDLALICACGTEVWPGIRPVRQTEQEAEFAADVHTAFVAPFAAMAAKATAEAPEPTLTVRMMTPPPPACPGCNRGRHPGYTCEEFAHQAAAIWQAWDRLSKQAQAQIVAFAAPTQCPPDVP